METTSENIRQLLEMLDNPEAYTEQEIQDIINRDEDTRETYRMMVEAKRNSRQRQADKPVDVDAAWKKFNEIHQSQSHGLGWIKIAASFIGKCNISLKHSTALSVSLLSKVLKLSPKYHLHKEP